MSFQGVSSLLHLPRAVLGLQIQTTVANFNGLRGFELKSSYLLAWQTLYSLNYPPTPPLWLFFFFFFHKELYSEKACICPLTMT